MTSALICLLASAVIGGRARAYTPSYTIYDLGTPTGDSQSFAMAINNLGHVAGYSSSSTATRPFFYNGSSMAALATGGSGTNAEYGMAINDYDEVAGYKGTGQGFIWDGTMNYIPTTDGTYNYQDLIFGINNNGIAVGYRRRVNAVHTAQTASWFTKTAYGGNLGITNSTSSNNGYASVAYDINNNSTKTTCGLWEHLADGDFAYNTTKADSINDLGPNNRFYGINDDAVACGVYSTNAVIYFQGSTAPTGWTKTYTIPRIGGVTNGTATAYSINSSKNVVGEAPYNSGSPTSYHAFFFDASTKTTYDLNNISNAGVQGMTLISGRGINDSNYICGWAIVGGLVHAYVAVP